MWDYFVLFTTLLFTIHYFSSQCPELVALFFVAIIVIKEVCSFMSAASKFTDLIPEELIRKNYISKESTKGEVICFKKAKRGAKEKAEKAKQQKVAK